MATTVIYQKRGNETVKVAETPDLSPYALKTDVDAELAEKANIDGYYEDMTVGNAEQLVSEDYVVDQTPYNFRTSGGNADIGNREIDKLVGGTLCWNQLIEGAFENWFKTGTTISGSIQDSILTLSSTQDDSVGANYYYKRISKVIVNHLYLISIDCKSSYVGTSTNAMIFIGSNTSKFSYVISSANTWEKASAISTATSEVCWIRVYNPYAAGTSQFKNAIAVDLTALFGTAIADYIYSLEQANAGAGVAWFRKLFPKTYYEYNAGELMSVQAASHDMVGFNQWDEEWEIGKIARGAGVNGLNEVSTTNIRSKNFIPVLPNTTYFCRFPSRIDGDSGANAILFWYDDNKNYISWHICVNMTRTSPANAAYARFYVGSVYGTTYNNDICINLSGSGYRNGEYEPYVKHSYPLDSIPLRGVYKLDAANNLYCDGDTYASDGTVERRYGMVDLGTLTWTLQTNASTGVQFFQAYLAGAANSKNTSTAGNIICSKYSAQPSSDASDKGIAISAGQGNPRLYVFDAAYTDAASFKSSLSGVMLVYELATPTSETASPYQNQQIVDDFGTEQYVDAAVEDGTRDVAVPVGHDTEYLQNLVDKLRRLPNLPDASGTYLVHYDATTGKCDFTEYTDDGRITALESKLPAAPTADGTYTLTLTIADGEATYSWA